MRNRSQIRPGSCPRSSAPVVATWWSPFVDVPTGNLMPAPRKDTLTNSPAWLVAPSAKPFRPNQNNDARGLSLAQGFHLSFGDSLTNLRCHSVHRNSSRPVQGPRRGSWLSGCAIPISSRVYSPRSQLHGPQVKTRFSSSLVPP